MNSSLASDSSLLPPAFSAIDLHDDLGQPFAIIGDVSPGPYERWLIDHRPFSPIAKLTRLLLNGKGTFLDVGANIGTISIPVAQHGSRVIAVEMLPQNCLKLNLAKQYNNLDQLTVFQGAASNVDGMVRYSGEEAWGVITHTDAAALAAGYRLDTILALTNAQFDRRISTDYVVKLDVEGHEYEAFKGASALIAQRPFIIFESVMISWSRDNSIAAIQFIIENGFELFSIDDGILIPYPKGGVQEAFLTDFLAVPSENVAQLATLVGNAFDIRNLTPDERLRIIQGAAMSAETIEHPLHAVSILEEWHSNDPAMAAMAQPLLERLVKHEDLTVAVAAQRVERMKS